MNSSKHEITRRPLSTAAFLQRVAELMPRLCRAMVRHERNHVTKGLLTLPQFWALEILREQKALPVHDIIGALQMKFSTGSMFVDRLAAMGLVRRVRKKMDRRVVDVVLTAKGRRIVDEIRRQRRKGMAEVFRPLTAQERGNYLYLMEKLARELSESKEST